MAFLVLLGHLQGRLLALFILSFEGSFEGLRRHLGFAFL